MRPVCLSTLKPIKGSGYSPAARRNLWGGARVAWTLPFDRAAFQSFRGKNSDRMSISGIQEKISLRLVANALEPTTQDSTHLLKPIPLALAAALELPEDGPANEHLTMQVAAQVFRLSAAPCGLIFFPDGAPALVVRRFDRRADSGRKLRQEDFCQLSGRSAQTAGRNFKYEGSYEECGQLVRTFCPAWRIAIERIFRQIVFNYLIGNGDAHLKNFSLIEMPSGDHALSPAYDLTPSPVQAETRRDLANRRAILAAAGRFLLQPAEANAIATRIFSTVANSWEATLREASVSPGDCQRLSRAFLYLGLQLDPEVVG